MKLEKKKKLVARALDVGVKRIVFNKERVSEIKEAITKQDMRDLFKDGAIKIKEVEGRKTNKKRKRRREGSVRRPIHNKKREYVNYVRRMRKQLSYLRKNGKINREIYYRLRREIRNKRFAKSQIADHIKEIENARN